MRLEECATVDGIDNQNGLAYISVLAGSLAYELSNSPTFQLSSRFDRRQSPPRMGARLRILPPRLCEPTSSSRPKLRMHGTPGVQWEAAISQALLFNVAQNAFRAATQDYTQSRLGGKFFPDWGRSIGNLHGWADGDYFGTNYVLHPTQGAINSFIFHTKRSSVPVC
jgi:hypothetical protein